MSKYNIQYNWLTNSPLDWYCVTSGRLCSWHPSMSLSSLQLLWVRRYREPPAQPCASCIHHHLRQSFQAKVKERICNTCGNAIRPNQYAAPGVQQYLTAALLLSRIGTGITIVQAVAALINSNTSSFVPRIEMRIWAFYGAEHSSSLQSN